MLHRFLKERIERETKMKKFFINGKIRTIDSENLSLIHI